MRVFIELDAGGQEVNGDLWSARLCQCRDICTSSAVAPMPLNYCKWAPWRQGSEKSICRSSPPVKRCQFAALPSGAPKLLFDGPDLEPGIWNLGIIINLKLNMDPLAATGFEPATEKPKPTEAAGPICMRSICNSLCNCICGFRFSVFQSILTVQTAKAIISLRMGFTGPRSTELGRYPGKMIKNQRYFG